MERQVRDTRQTISCSVDVRRQICQIASTLFSNRISKIQSNISTAGRSLGPSPRKSLCSKCGQFMDSHDKNSRNKILEHPKSAHQAGKLFAERVQARGQTDRFACDYLIFVH